MIHFAHSPKTTKAVVLQVTGTRVDVIAMDYGLESRLQVLSDPELSVEDECEFDHDSLTLTHTKTRRRLTIFDEVTVRVWRGVGWDGERWGDAR